MCVCMVYDGGLLGCCVLLLVCGVFFFFKQKTAYEMRISDWSSDVCSSDLFALVADFAEARGHEARHARLDRRIIVRLTKPVRQFVDTPGARERQHQRAGEEMIAPENIFLGSVGQRLF